MKKIDSLVGKCIARCLPRATKNLFSPNGLVRILIVRPGGIGDAVLLIPIIIALKQTHPSATIDILAEKRNASIFSLCPHVDHLFHYDRPREFFSVFRQRYDVILDAEQWHRLSAVVARLIRSDWKIGFATNDRRRLFTHGVEYSHDEYEVESFFHLLTPLGVTFHLDLIQPFLQVPLSAQQKAEQLLKSINGPFVTLFPGASIPERRWGADRFKALASHLLSEGWQIVVVGGGEDREAGEEIVAQGGLNLAGRTSLVETAGVLEKSALLVSGDSGVLHLAVGLGIPTVSLFGPGIAAKWAPRGERHRVVNLNFPCSPCTRFGTTPPCPVQGRCIQDITVDEVSAKVRELLPQVEPGRP